MDLKEALGKITDPEARKFFETMVANQNSYITKLENQLKEQPKPQAGNVDDVTKAYIQKKMREEVYADATAKIIATIGKDKFDAVKADFDSFLEKNMKAENTKLEYALDAFNLVFGRCQMDPNHPIHQVGKATNPGGTPAPQTVGNNGAQVGVVQNILAGQPPVMTSNDANAGTAVPGGGGEKISSTKDAFKHFQDRMRGDGSNKFQ